MLHANHHLGNVYMYAVGSSVIFLAIIGWLAMVVHTSKERESTVRTDPGRCPRAAGR